MSRKYIVLFLFIRRIIGFKLCFERVNAYIALQLRYSCDAFSHARWNNNLVYIARCAPLLSLAFASSQFKGLKIVF